MTSRSNAIRQRIVAVVRELEAIGAEAFDDAPELAALYTAFAETLESHAETKEGHIFELHLPPRCLVDLQGLDFSSTSLAHTVKLFLETTNAD